MRVPKEAIVIVFFVCANLAGLACANTHNWFEAPTVERRHEEPDEFVRIVNAAEHIAVSFKRWEETDFK